MYNMKNRISAFVLSFLLVTAVFLNVPELSVNTNAASITSIGLAEHGLKAYNDKWVYHYGGNGEKTSSGTRRSDCSGLIYSYFTDNGTTGPRTVTQQVSASVQHGPLDTIPRIHGLIITYPNNSHDGIYLGNGIVVDNSDYGVNMLMGSIYSSRGWNQWHMLDAGIQYPKSGFYAFNGNMYHYSNFQYDVNTTVSYAGTEYTIGDDGIVCDSSGSSIGIDSSLPNDGFTAAGNVVLGEQKLPDGRPADVNANSVRMRNNPSLTANIITTLNKGTVVYILDTVTGDEVKTDTRTSNEWYKVSTLSGTTGYISTVYVDKSGTDYVSGSGGNKGPIPKDVISPDISVGIDFRIYMDTKNDNAAIYYTTDCSEPDTSSGTIYNTPIVLSDSTTYKAVTVHGGSKSNVSLLTVLSSGAAFTDITTDAWYYQFVEEALLLEYFKGLGDNTFAPNMQITRAQFVAVLANMASEDVSTYTNSSFSDIKSDAWYDSAVAWCQDKGYVTGYPDNTFHPDSLISREEMCVILTKYLQLDKSSGDDNGFFNDHDKISDWAIDSVYACKSKGIVNGKGGNKFEPKDSATRAESATMIIQSF